jgi:hypothetical protein
MQGHELHSILTGIYVKPHQPHNPVLHPTSFLAETSALVLHIRKVPGSNLGPGTNNPENIVRGISQFLSV